MLNSRLFAAIRSANARARNHLRCNTDVLIAEALHQRCDRGTVTIVEIEQGALEIAGNDDIHARRQGVRQRFPVVAIAGKETVQDIVDIGGDYQLLDRQTHAPRQVAGVDITEISGRDRKRHLA